MAEKSRENKVLRGTEEVDLTSIPVLTRAQLGSVSICHSPIGMRQDAMTSAERDEYAEGLRPSAKDVFRRARDSKE